MQSLHEDIFSAKDMHDIRWQKHPYGNHPVPEVQQILLLAYHPLKHVPVRSDDKEIYACALQDAEFHTYLNYKSPGIPHMTISSYRQQPTVSWKSFQTEP